MSAPPPILLTEAEAAAALRLSPRTLRKARQAGLLHYVLIGRSVRYTMDDLESYVASLRQVQQPCPPNRPTARSSKPSKRSGVIVPFTVRNTRR
ncbi:helix-turn-helix domain-containing protein [Altererythrobacter sp. CC-YST694]|uniref:helix-turn-helix domain-containing protein n=1 Tax=Altererythrobacter sp. CC-YST694 TaxID=2755038 RepID=UPI001D01EDCD|nr:helix-turn-helix domain-containing protein [Altererythrobacter sp. CC-YST694]